MIGIVIFSTGVVLTLIVLVCVYVASCNMKRKLKEEEEEEASIVHLNCYVQDDGYGNVEFLCSVPNGIWQDNGYGEMEYYPPSK